MRRKRCLAGLKNSLPGAELNMQRLLLLFLALLFASMPLQAAFDGSHAQWNALLKKHVQWNAAGTTTSVDYPGFAKDRVSFDSYLKNISSVSKKDYANWTLQDQQAFLINAYNAYTVQLVLTRYPDLSSIKDLGSVFSSPWKQKFFVLLGEKRSLDDVEHTLLRGDKRYKEPRIHFSVNCASIGCPALRDEAFISTKLGSQLEDQTIRFLSDRSRNRFDQKTATFTVSKIFDWYSEDFDKHAGGVKSFLVFYSDKIKLPVAEANNVKQAKFKIDYFNYDWSLNKTK